MALSKNISTYADVHQVLVAAEKAGGALYLSETPGAAHQFRLRGNYYKKLLSEIHNVHTFDALVLRKSLSNDCETRIEINRPVGKIFSLDGTEIEPELSTPADIIPKAGSLRTPEGKEIISDPVEQEARALMARLSKGDLFDDKE